MHVIFSSKEDLLTALADDLFQKFRAWIDERLDPADAAPGRLVRACVRAVLTPEDDVVSARGEFALVAQLMTMPAAAEIAREHGRRLDEDLRADGLYEDVRVLIVAAADGANSAVQWGGVPPAPATLRRLQDRLVQLTREPDLWERIPWAASAST